MKICSRCKIEKDLTDFYRDSRSSNGYRSICKSCDIKRSTQWNNTNKDRHKEHESTWRRNNLLKSRQKRKDYTNSNRGKEVISNWTITNRDKIKAYAKKYYNEKYKKDPLYTVRRLTSNRLTKSIKKRGFSKRSKTADMLGCSWDEFRIYLESKFQLGMSWDNYGDWEIDHIVPCRSATTEQELLLLQNYTNLQPLWKEDHKLKTKKDLNV